MTGRCCANGVGVNELCLFKEGNVDGGENSTGLLSYTFNHFISCDCIMKVVDC